MEIKICGITKENEVEYINNEKVDYVGFVFFEPSKRNVSYEQAEMLMNKVDKGIKKVAVMVSPSLEMIEQVEKLPVDILQIHKELSEDVLKKVNRPVWYAVNIDNEDEIEEKTKFIDEMSDELKNKVKAIVVDAPAYGSGKTFTWRKSKRLLKAGAQSPPERKFVLAGGLNSENVSEGIKLFAPDIVDVSSGVEGENGKEESKIKAFVANARNAQKELGI